MKKLLTLAALALSLGLSSQSFADSNIFGVQTPIDRKEVKDNVYSGYVAKNLQDGFHVQKLQNPNSSTTKGGYVAKNLQDGFHVQKLQNPNSSTAKIDNE